MTSPLLAECLQRQDSEPSQISPASEKPKLALVPTQEPVTEITAILRIFRAQQRECWFCSKIASEIEKGKAVSDDENWHFTTCVTSWEKNHT